MEGVICGGRNEERRLMVGEKDMISARPVLSITRVYLVPGDLPDRLGAVREGVVGVTRHPCVRVGLVRFYRRLSCLTDSVARQSRQVRLTADERVSDHRKLTSSITLRQIFISCFGRARIQARPTSMAERKWESSTAI